MITDSSVKLPTTVIIAVNERGIWLLDAEDLPLLHIPYYQLVTVEKKEIGVLTITLFGSELSFNGVTDLESLVSIATAFINGLRKRSRYGIAMQKVVPTQGGELSVEAGDLVEFNAFGIDLGDKAVARCVKSDCTGIIEVSKVFCLAAMLAPTDTELAAVVSGKITQYHDTDFSSVLPYGIAPTAATPKLKARFEGGTAALDFADNHFVGGRRGLLAPRPPVVGGPLLKSLHKLGAAVSDITVSITRAIRSYIGDGEHFSSMSSYVSILQ